MMPAEVIQNDTPILVVEDSDIDYEAMSRLFRQARLPNPVHRCLDGDEAIEFLQQEGRYSARKGSPRPGMVLLDLNLPGTDGWEVLRRMKNTPELRRIPVLIITGSAHPQDVHNAYDSGAATYLCKPEEASEYGPLFDLIRHYWFGNRFVHLA